MLKQVNTTLIPFWHSGTLKNTSYRKLDKNYFHFQRVIHRFCIAFLFLRCSFYW